MKFFYRAIVDKLIVKGTIEAESDAGVADYLKSNNYTIIEIKKLKTSFLASSSVIFSRIKFNDIVDFTRQLAIMLGAGLTIVDSLDILKKQTTSPALLKLFNSIDSDVRSGNSLSSAIAKFRNHFSNLYISLVKAGEASGKLDEILQKLADNLEKQRAFQSKIKGALIYPAIVVVAMLLVMFIMMAFVVPKLLTVYKEFDVELPITTKFLIATSDIFSAFWPFMIIGVVVLIWLLKMFLKSSRGKRIFDTYILKVPLFSKIIKIAALVDTTRTLAVLLAAGVSILESLDIVVETASNSIFGEALKEVHKKIEKGQSIGKSLDEAQLFPPILVQMTAVGEQTGHLDETLMRLSNYFEAESELAVKSVTTLIEPAILIVLGLSVGFIVIALITPIFNLTSSIK